MTNSIRKIRESKGMSQAKLAELSGLPQSNISCYETGGKFMREDTIRKLCSALQVDPTELMAEEKE